MPIEEKADLNELNEIVVATFGKKFGKPFKCNYSYHYGVFTEGMVTEIDEPEYIATNGWGVEQTFNRIAGWIGDEKRQGPKDGSIITVYPNYSEEAVRYSHEYERRTGKKVSIRFPLN